MNRLLRSLLAVWALFLAAPAAAAADFVRGSDGILTFNHAELAFDPSWRPPSDGWERRAVPAPILTDELKRRENGQMTLWARMEFDLSALPAGPIAFYTVNTRERFVLLLNGTEIYRNFAGAKDEFLGWNRPFLVELPESLLRDGRNEVTMRIDTGVYWHVGIGTVQIGPSSLLEAERSYIYFWRIPGVMIAQGVMMAATVYALLLWLLGWRDRRALLWSLIGMFWLFRNFHFFVERPLFEATLFRDISHYLIYFVVALTYSFCAEVFNVKRRRLFNILQYTFAIFICILRYVLIQRELSDVLCNILTLISGTSVIYIAVVAYWKSLKLEHLLILFGLIATAAFSLHDIGRTSNVLAWDGMGFFLQPYAGFVMAWAFFVPVALNIVRSFHDTSQMNNILENKIIEVTAALKDSEAKLREQQVVVAVNQERDRLMREIHDGIGSNLVTALAVAERQRHPPESVATLKRSLSDLKLTVDSLEAVDGDVVVLLANLRHRMDPDLRDAGLKCTWSVEACPPLSWLDPVNALHLLRLIQEAVSNVVTHAQARLVAIQCGPALRGNRSGIQIEISDDGIGFDSSGNLSSGRGLNSMISRAKSLGGQIELGQSEQGGGSVTVWLPQVRS